MDANKREYIDGIAKKIIGAAYEVSNELGSGFLEKVYERSLAIELKGQGIELETQVNLPVNYKNQLVGTYITDMLVAKQIMVELKCVEKLAKVHTAQCINYLKASNLPICLLINFQHPKVEWKRIVHDF